MRVEIWSDVVCPWCYIGKRRFENALAGFAHRADVEVIHRSFQLDPTTPRGETYDTTTMLAEKYGVSPGQVQAMTSRVEQTAAGEGLDYHLGATRSGNTLDAHRVLHLARAQGRQAEVLERFYRAYFTEGQSLFDTPSLVRLAAEAGLDPGDVQRVLDGDDYADAVAADGYEAAALGAGGVPFFVVDGRYGISGAQPREVFARALAQAWSESHPLTALAGPAAVGDGAGGAGDDVSCTDGRCADARRALPAADAV
jgi:predicted DsbA family dithiol-disulfide isomerase